MSFEKEQKANIGEVVEKIYIKLKAFHIYGF